MCQRGIGRVATSAAALAMVLLAGCSSGGGPLPNRAPAAFGEGPVTLAFLVGGGDPITVRLDWIDGDGLPRSRTHKVTRRRPIDLRTDAMPVYDITLESPYCPESDDDSPEARVKDPWVIGDGPTTLAFGIRAGDAVRVWVQWSDGGGASLTRSFKVTERQPVHLRVDQDLRYEITLADDC